MTTGERIRSCSMVVTAPNLFVGDVHDRMPVVLEKGDFDAWMKGSVDEAKALMKPAAENSR